MINLKIKTPVWTGDIDTKSSLLQSTGIIGSLRWWTEAILRGMGKCSCDPASDERCPKEINDQKHYCASCLIFGATGMRRLFRLELNGGTKVFDGRALNIKPDGRNRGWYLGSGLVGDIKLNIVPLDESFDESLVLVPLTVAAKWGGIGAKTQHGYGVVEMENDLNIDFEKFSNLIESILNNQRLSKLGLGLRIGNNDRLPDLKKMFFAKVHFEVTDNDWWKQVDGIKPDNQRNYRGHVNDQRMINWVDSSSVPIAPAIKNWLRFDSGQNLWKTNDQNRNREIENWLFGTIRNTKTASKINISCAYKVNDNLWEFRIWGWIPKDELPEGFDRDRFLDNLKRILDRKGVLDRSGSLKVPWDKLLGDKTRNHGLKIWREFGSTRDTVKQNENNINDYIKSLLEGEKQ